jgi:hypothetical protein
MILHRLSPLAALPLALGCSDTTSPGRTLGIEATLAPTRLPVGDTLTVTVTATNITSTTVSVPGGPPLALLEVRDATGRVVEFGNRQPVDLIMYAPRTLAPGESATDQIFWAGEVSSASGRATPGTYQLRAAVPVLGPDRQAYVFSAPLTLTLTAP